MSLLDKMGKAFDNTGDWVTRGSIPVVTAKMTGVIGTVIGTMLSPFFLAAHLNAKDLEERLDFLDHHPTEVFQSVANCEDKRFLKQACQESQEEALSVAKGLGTSLSYDTLDECTMKHKAECSEDMTTVTTHITTYTTSNTSSSGFNQGVAQTQSINTDISSYHPPVVAWQAASDDLKKAVPLYPAQREGFVVRSDGKEFEL